jgi:hypothetical protein
MAHGWSYGSGADAGAFGLMPKDAGRPPSRAPTAPVGNRHGAGQAEGRPHSVAPAGFARRRAGRDSGQACRSGQGCASGQARDGRPAQADGAAGQAARASGAPGWKEVSEARAR